MDPHVSAWTQPVEPPGPAPGLSFGGAGERLIAYIVDGLIIGVINMVLALVLIALLFVALWPAV